MKSYLYLLIISLSAFFIILIVLHFGDIPNKHNNGFKRNYFYKSFSGTHEIELRDTLDDIIGATRWNIYVSLATQGEVLQIGKGPDAKIKRIKIPFFTRFYDSLAFNSLVVQIDSPFMYLFAENKPAIIKTDFDSTLFEIKILPPGSFTREVKAGADCFILRKVDLSLSDQLFVRYNFRTGLLKREENISQMVGDGGIVTDGQLHFDVEAKKLCYIYYYKNQLLSFDTSLNSVNRFSSIDTTYSFKIKTGLVKNSGTTAYTNITPANIINKANAVHDGVLFNMSALKADNESDKFFGENSIIDLIDLKNGRYRGSMIFPTFKGSKLSKFIISDNRLIGLYANSIVIYDLAFDAQRRDQ